MSPWQLMALPFLECLVLVGIHSYLGIHVIKRKVIFVDLALAQIAALGTIVQTSQVFRALS
jgi:zinc/manganese transport system permease protein